MLCPLWYARELATLLGFWDDTRRNVCVSRSYANDDGIYGAEYRRAQGGNAEEFEQSHFAKLELIPRVGKSSARARAPHGELAKNMRYVVAPVINRRRFSRVRMHVSAENYMNQR